MTLTLDQVSAIYQRQPASATTVSSAVNTARDCAGQDARCVEQWSAKQGVEFSHVFIARSPAGACCRKLSSTLRTDSRYQVVFDGPGAEIFERRQGRETVSAP